MKKLICQLFGHNTLPVYVHGTNELSHYRCVRCGETSQLPDYKNPPPPPPMQNIELKKEQLEYLNKRRKENGFPPLSIEDILYQSARCFIKAEDGRHFVFMPTGEKIPMQQKTIVIDNFEKGKAKVHLTLFVDIL